MTAAANTTTETQNALAACQRASLACPNCGDADVLTFYEASGVPSHSCLLMNSPGEARAYPSGDVQLGFCNTCGFVGNVRWDAKLTAYSTSYEETQHFSDTFNRFAQALAQRWIDQYDIRNKTILEIGCGKAEFLALLCQLGGNRGIGVDPSVIPERLPDDTRSRIRFIRDYYSTDYGHLKADVICCRHTLEHIFDTKLFLETVRRSIGSRKDTLILFELPDATRVLRECAFWDIYYEHCSYFTAGSLARLFRQCNFDVIELQRDYGDQYLLLAARPADGDTQPRLELEDDFQQTVEDVSQFHQTCQGTIGRWRQRLQALAAAGKRTIAWGAGSKCVAFCTTLHLTDEIAYAVDINPHKQGRFLPGTGHPVVGPEHLKKEPPDAVLVMNPIYSREIRTSLQSVGIGAELMPLGASV